MSLRKSPQLTPALLAAARQNAQHSAGPRSRPNWQSSSNGASNDFKAAVTGDWCLALC